MIRIRRWFLEFVKNSVVSQFQTETLPRILSRRIAVFKFPNSARSLSEVALHKESLAGFRTSPIRIRRYSPIANV